MPRYYFDVMSGNSVLEDMEGSELVDLNHAVAEALEDARALMSEAVRQGHDISDGSIVIRNGDRTLLKVIRFTDALDRKS
ncbi:hypothetical protein [Rhizobium sp. RM]|uniref:DUF6894 family protein n=1 Tax=Rhizobium sp. RM TaxID=2748079 RepID=UPI00110E13E2|nr:hypothetical protein [Rhizobium sp. RM]NWJ27556.1 hypothetical protein [Rhizobium sp. RM]TMV19986.1 hypothetical protein BJG94_11365 [Rhizobium sp. Td3]